VGEIIVEGWRREVREVREVMWVGRRAPLI
jgi:hypothetical protein